MDKLAYAVFGVLLITVRVSTYGYEKRSVTGTVNVYVGQDAILECGDYMEDLDNIFLRRYWRRDNDVIAIEDTVIINDKKFEVVNKSAVLIIRNVAKENGARYTCTANTLTTSTKYDHTLTVKDFYCSKPVSIENGWLDDNGPKTYSYNPKTYSYGVILSYYCSHGYQLIGNEHVTCSKYEDGGWSHKAPTCQSEYLVQINDRVEEISKKTTILIEDKLPLIERRLDTLEDNATSHSDHQTSHHSNDIFTPSQIASNTNLYLNSLKDVLNEEIGHVSVKDGHLVSEYIFAIKSFEEVANESRNEELVTISSPSFYTNVPGYKLGIRLFLDYNYTGFVGISAYFCQGDFDDLIAWPFTNRYDLTILSLNEQNSTSHTVIPSNYNECDFERPIAGNSNHCGVDHHTNINTILDNKNLYLFNKALLVKITVHLDG